MAFIQVANTGNERYRNEWVWRMLSKYRPQSQDPRLLDVGAGDSPYRELAVGLGYTYTSHDFGGYVPSNLANGLQNSSWNYASHDFNCDILEIPETAVADVVLCTEVLEHVPDPVRAFQRMASLVRPSGALIVTVPFISLMHQAPFWFQSGLSPYWFVHWAERNELELRELEVQGDYIDLMAQEVGRLLTFRPRVKGMNRVASKAVLAMRGITSRDVLQAGGIGTLFVATREP